MIDTKGDIITNDHVVDGATSITVKFKNGTTTKATLVGKDAGTDLAVIKVDPSATTLTPLTLGDSAAVQTGQGVFAIGSPFGLADSLTAGIVSATGRTIQSPDNHPITNAIQTDAAINHGNSGGPLLDTSGKVIGVNSQIDSDSGGNDGVGFAIPSNTVKSITSQLIAGQKVAHPLLGVYIGDAPNNGGAQVSKVTPQGPAATAGVKAGDTITAIDSTRGERRVRSRGRDRSRHGRPEGDAHDPPGGLDLDDDGPGHARLHVRLALYPRTTHFSWWHSGTRRPGALPSASGLRHFVSGLEQLRRGEPGVLDAAALRHQLAKLGVELGHALVARRVLGEQLVQLGLARVETGELSLEAPGLPARLTQRTALRRDDRARRRWGDRAPRAAVRAARDTARCLRACARDRRRR